MCMYVYICIYTYIYIYREREREIKREREREMSYYIQHTIMYAIIAYKAIIRHNIILDYIPAVLSVRLLLARADGGGLRTAL